MLRRLRLRLTLISAVTTAAVLYAAIWLLIGAFGRRLEENARTAFEGSLSAAIYQLQNERVIAWSWLSRMEADNRLLIAVSDNGELLRFPGSHQARTGREELLALLLADAPPGSLSPNGRLSVTHRFVLTGQLGERYFAAVAAVPIGEDVRMLYLVQDLEEFELGNIRWICFAAALFGTLALTALCWWLSGHALIPAEKSWEQQNEFVAAASHELRSPLGVLRASAAALAAGYAASADPESAEERLSDADSAAFAKAIDQECARMGRLVDDLLTLANADAGRLMLRPGPVEPELMLEETSLLFSPMAQEKGIALILVPCGALPVMTADEERLRQLIAILLDNALQYTPEGGFIRLSAESSGKRMSLQVADNGPGIPESEREQVFRRFYRSDRARGDKEHCGLGLSIAADIARLHGGTLTLSETPGGGLTVRYTQLVSPPELKL